MIKFYIAKFVECSYKQHLRGMAIKAYIRRRKWNIHGLSMKFKMLYKVQQSKSKESRREPQRKDQVFKKQGTKKQ